MECDSDLFNRWREFSDVIAECGEVEVKIQLASMIKSAHDPSCQLFCSVEWEDGNVPDRSLPFQRPYSCSGDFNVGITVVQHVCAFFIQLGVDGGYCCAHMLLVVDFAAAKQVYIARVVKRIYIWTVRGYWNGLSVFRSVGP